MIATEVIKEALREYVGDGDGADEEVLAQHNAAVVADLDLPTIIAETLPCTWSVGESGHPHAPNCFYKRHGEGHGVCWDRPHAIAAAIRAAVSLQD